MRLDNEEKIALEQAIKDLNDKVYIFGSRVDEKKRGGDIDILVYSDKNAYQLSQEISIKFFMHCEEKIDVVVMNPKKLTREQKAFLNVIKKQRIK